MYKNYENKLMSIPKICEKKDRASDEKYFVSLYLEQIPFFQNLPPVVKDTILSQLRTCYYKTGECIHQEGAPDFMAVIFVGAVTWKTDKKPIVK
jgi:signal-transduction protein with cAMP-binding, CBS, and nucleotidyltransferase domain